MDPRHAARDRRSHDGLAPDRREPSHVGARELELRPRVVSLGVRDDVLLVEAIDLAVLPLGVGERRLRPSEIGLERPVGVEHRENLSGANAVSLFDLQARQDDREIRGAGDANDAALGLQAAERCHASRRRRRARRGSARTVGRRSEPTGRLSNPRWQNGGDRDQGPDRSRPRPERTCILTFPRHSMDSLPERRTRGRPRWLQAFLLRLSAPHYGLRVMLPGASAPRIVLRSFSGLRI